MSSSGPSSADVLWFQGEYLFHMFGSYQVCIEGSSPTEGPKTSINFWGGLASMSSYITGMWLWRSWRFVLVYRKTDILLGFLDLPCEKSGGEMSVWGSWIKSSKDLDASGLKSRLDLRKVRRNVYMYSGMG